MAQNLQRIKMFVGGQLSVEIFVMLRYCNIFLFSHQGGENNNVPIQSDS